MANDIKVCPVHVRAITTIGPDAQCWKRTRFAWTVEQGALYRLIPPPKVSAEDVEAMKQTLLKAGAAAVKVEHVAKMVAPRDVELPKSPGVREAVFELAEASAFPRKKDLKDALERVLEKVRL